MEENRVKMRVFIYIDGIKVSAVSEDDKFFEYKCEKATVKQCEKAFAAFRRFCRVECGFIDTNDEVVFDDDADSTGLRNDLSRYFELRLGRASWCVVKSVEFDYKSCVPVGGVRSYNKFKKERGSGIKEPQLTRQIYGEYKRLVDKDVFTPDELSVLIEYILSHLDILYRRGGKDMFHRRYADYAGYRIAWCLAAVYRSDIDRFYETLNFVLDDFKRRISAKKEKNLSEVLEFTADEISDRGIIDAKRFRREEKLLPLKRSYYKMYSVLQDENRVLVERLIGSGEGEKAASQTAISDEAKIEAAAKRILSEHMVAFEELAK